MPLHSRTRPPGATVISIVSPRTPEYTPARKHLFCTSLPNLHNGQTPGHSPRSLFPFVPFSCIAFMSCFPLLSFISLVPMFATLVPCSRKSDPTFPPFDIYCTTLLPILTIDVVIVIKTPLSDSTLHTLTMFSLVTPSKTHCVFKFLCILYTLRSFFVWFLRCICAHTRDILLSPFLLSSYFWRKQNLGDSPLIRPVASRITLAECFPRRRHDIPDNCPAHADKRRR